MAVSSFKSMFPNTWNHNVTLNKFMF